MYPYYHQASGLTQEDIDAILQLYAAQDAQPTPAPGTPNPNPGTPSDVPPLTLMVQIPTSPTTASSIAISGSTAGGSGAVQVSWTTNNGSSGMAQGATTWTISSVPLNLGDNVITIAALDSSRVR
jgi:hypothetical protein